MQSQLALSRTIKQIAKYLGFGLFGPFAVVDYGSLCVDFAIWDWIL